MYLHKSHLNNIKTRLKWKTRFTDTYLALFHMLVSILALLAYVYTCCHVIRGKLMFKWVHYECLLVSSNTHCHSIHFCFPFSPQHLTGSGSNCVENGSMSVSSHVHSKVACGQLHFMNANKKGDEKKLSKHYWHLTIACLRKPFHFSTRYIKN